MFRLLRLFGRILPGIRDLGHVFLHHIALAVDLDKFRGGRHVLGAHNVVPEGVVGLRKVEAEAAQLVVVVVVLAVVGEQRVQRVPPEVIVAVQGRNYSINTRDCQYRQDYGAALSRLTVLTLTTTHKAVPNNNHRSA